MKFPGVTAFVSTAAFVNNNNEYGSVLKRNNNNNNNNNGVVPLQLGFVPSADIIVHQSPEFPSSSISSSAASSSVASFSSTSRSSSSNINNNLLQQNVMEWLQETVGVPPASAAAAATTTTTAAAAPPTKEDIQTLRNAFAAFYGASRDAAVAEQLLSQSIEAWSRQPPDEQAGLYRVRGDCYMALLRPQDAIKDYSTTIALIQGPGGDKGDPAELPAAFLGRARAYRSLHTKATKEEARQGVSDYLQAIKLSAREEWDTDQELLEDGARTNPYATWEYGMALRLVGDYSQAQEIHTLASDYFDDIGDRARSVISAIDAGIDAAALADNNKSSETAKALLKNAIQRTKTVEGRDIPLLQRVIAKEGEARLALASVLWVNGEKPDAENQIGVACQRLDQLEADAIARNKINKPPQGPPRLTFNIDDGVAALDINCGVLKNKDYLANRLEWPLALQEKAQKLNKLN